MQAIEFETDLKNGLIRLPSSFQNWQEGKHVKVIVLADDTAQNESVQSINRHAGKISLTQDPSAFQKSLRDEWT